MKTIIKKIKISADINVITGLHIGGNSESVEIGGVDNTVIKLAYSTREGQPFIPGSSLRGKMRCLLEQTGKNAIIGEDEDVNKLFGYSNKSVPSRLIVRDAYLTADCVDRMKMCDDLDLPFTEVKSENSIDRIKGTAQNPRQTERVPAGSVFHSEFIINIWDDDNEIELMNMLKKGISLLKHDYLGGNGSRGYGQVDFVNFKIYEATNESGWSMKEYTGHNIFSHEN